ncbi:hypothetical protein M0804_002082 [Polistes exclamans]|nr:hypothetical protein M0804_002082 [Polistes exclamans]
MRQLNGGVIIPAVLWLSEKISGLPMEHRAEHKGQTMFLPIMATFEKIISETTDKPAGFDLCSENGFGFCLWAKP